MSENEEHPAAHFSHHGVLPRCDVGLPPGHVHGQTDEFGYQATDGRMSCPDLLATILHQLGLDHDHLYFAHHGRKETLTDSPVTDARVVRELLA